VVQWSRTSQGRKSIRGRVSRLYLLAWLRCVFLVEESRRSIKHAGRQKRDPFPKRNASATFLKARDVCALLVRVEVDGMDLTAP
jgi:hypothetical protein